MIYTVITCRTYLPFSFSSPNDHIQASPRPADGFEYDRLTEVAKGFESEEIKSNKGGTTFRSFDSTTAFVGEGGHGVEWGWVRTSNVGAFRRDCRAL